MKAIRMGLVGLLLASVLVGCGNNASPSARQNAWDSGRWNQSVWE